MSSSSHHHHHHHQLHWYESLMEKRREVLWVVYFEVAHSYIVTFITSFFVLQKDQKLGRGWIASCKNMFSNGYGLLLSGTWNTLACLMLLISLQICGSFETDFLCLLPLVHGTSLSWWVNFLFFFFFILTAISRGICCTSLNRLRKMSCYRAEPKTQCRQKTLGRSSRRKIKSKDRYYEVTAWAVWLWTGHWNGWKWKWNCWSSLPLVVRHQI